MTILNTGVSRRGFLRQTAVLGLAAGAASSLRLPAFAQSDLPDIQSILDKISVKDYVREDYRKLYSMSDEPLWDPAKDWIRTVDWEQVRSEQAGKTVRFAVGAADQESAAEGLKPFEQLSGIKVELVPIPDDSFYDKAVSEFISGNASFDALQFFSPWLGDFAGPGFLYDDLGAFVEKWKLPLDDFYDTYRLNYGYFGGKLVGIPFDCDIQMVHLRKSIMLRELIAEMPLKTTKPPQQLVRGSAAEFWPEGYVATTFCLTVYAATMDQEFHTEVEIDRVIDDLRSWWSFRENANEDTSYAAGFFQRVLGNEPNWSMPANFNARYQRNLT